MHHIWSDHPEQLKESATLWRYFKPERLIELLKSSALYFAAATQFDDRFEGAVRIVDPGAPAPDPNSQASQFAAYFRNKSPFAKISCWHETPFESDAMWRLYADRGCGVALRTTVGKLRGAIAPSWLANSRYYSEPMLCGKVRYIDLFKEKVPSVSTRPVGLHKRYFYKHLAFEWEREFRLLLPLYDRQDNGIASGNQGIPVVCDLLALVDAIVIECPQPTFLTGAYR
jgi:hypothetical protein